jgi:enoyl-CoA hydratase/carnithine racemase
MSLIDLRREGSVFVLTMQALENRFNRPFIDAFNAALDEVEKSSGPAALVTAGQEKFYSNGLDLAWLSGKGASEGGSFVSDVLRTLGRVMAFPMITVAAINGHAFAAGGMLALAHDYRVMRSDRGFFCLPEVDIKLPLAPGMTALIHSRLDAAAFRDTILTGARLGGEACAARGIVDAAASAEQVLPRAIERAAGLADKDREAVRVLKRGMYGDTLALLESGQL